MKSKTFFFGLLFVGIQVLSGQERAQSQIEIVLNNWHKAAGEANFDTYFDLMTSDAVFIGTDATEYWEGEAFKIFAKPYFDRGKAWNFTPLERHIYVNESMAWFDELLETQMGICRGSGVLKNVNGSWKIAHYVLSIAVPNENVTELTALKKGFDNQLIEKLKN
jgi:ketosteroid isomerase-like protein